MKRSLIYLFFSFFLSVLTAYSFQNESSAFKQYEGEVVDANNGKALVFATLMVEGTNISTITNTEGDFILKVPVEMSSTTVSISFLGYTTKTISFDDLTPEDNTIELAPSAVQLSEVNVNAPKDPRALVLEVFKKKGNNYMNDPALMTAFYRETIKKRRRNVSLSEAVVNIYKSSYESSRKDAVKLFKARKSTDYSKLDTLALKLQGGPFNTLYSDIVKYPDIVFLERDFDQYEYKFARSTRINNQLIYVISFSQKKNIPDQLYKGELFIDVEQTTLTSAIYELNITNKDMAAQLFVRKKPSKVDVWPTDIAYRVDYRNTNGKWYYGYSNVLLEFKVNWKDKLFNSVYTMTAEMAVTDWEKNLDAELPKNRERIKSTIILADEASGFSDPDFWGEYNIIEPEKSIESAIKKIQRQLKRAERKGAAAPTP